MANPSGIPEFLDTGHCACGLVKSPSQTGASLLWRCVGNERANLDHGTTGKWFNTTNHELIGDPNGQILNTPSNGPNTDQVVVWNDGRFAKSFPQAPSLLPADHACTGKNDTASTASLLGGSSGSNTLYTGTISTPVASSVVVTSSATPSTTSSQVTATNTSPAAKSFAYKDPISVQSAIITLILSTFVLSAVYA